MSQQTYSFTRVTTVSNGDGKNYAKSPIESLPSPNAYSSVYRTPLRNSTSTLNSSSTATSHSKPGEDRARSGNNMATYNTSSSYNRTYEKKVIEEGNPHVRVTTQTHTPLTSSGVGSVLPDINNIHQSMLSQFPNMSIGGGVAAQSNLAQITSVRVTNTSFHASIDVSKFDADSLKVTVVDNNVIVEGSHGEKEDSYGTISTTFKRKLPLPKTVPAESVQSQLTADGFLTIDAKAPEPKLEGARPIQIKVINSSENKQ
ncbi:unnamed protein product [Caenorhabditis angaria]|uniref:SHSP domain-containing protein n=1 Tax=Caenorhabditis angaria TaxID=860376 RepID=A0A9P1IP96_9PELO|nr:unnamed protein product [Caenorhabditis angaria]